MGPTVDWLLEYEVAAANRYRRFLSLALLNTTDGQRDHMSELLSESLRACDKVMTVDGQTAVVMSETRRGDARKALERFFASVRPDQDARVALASYPEDGKTGVQIMAAARNRLDRAGPGGERFIDTDAV